jgi:hypothetical protein
LVICEGSAEPREGPAAEVGAAAADGAGTAAGTGRGVANSGRRSSWSWLSLNWFGQPSGTGTRLRGEANYRHITYRRHFHFANLAIVVFIVQAVTKDIAKRLETPLDPVRHRFLLRLRTR